MVYLNLHNLEVIIHLLNHKVFEPKEQKIISSMIMYWIIFILFLKIHPYITNINVDILDFVYVFQNI